MICLSSDMIRSQNENILKTFEMTHFDNSFYLIGITPILKRSNSQLISLKHKKGSAALEFKKSLKFSLILAQNSVFNVTMTTLFKGTSSGHDFFRNLSS